MVILYGIFSAFASGLWLTTSSKWRVEFSICGVMSALKSLGFRSILHFRFSAYSCTAYTGHSQHWLSTFCIPVNLWGASQTVLKFILMIALMRNYDFPYSRGGNKNQHKLNNLSRATPLVNVRISTQVKRWDLNSDHVFSHFSFLPSPLGNTQVHKGTVPA
jgi:hypothetical protein